LRQHLRSAIRAWLARRARRPQRRVRVAGERQTPHRAIAPAPGRAIGSRPWPWHASDRRMHSLRARARLPQDDVVDPQRVDRGAVYLRAGRLHTDVERAKAKLWPRRRQRALGFGALAFPGTTPETGCHFTSSCSKLAEHRGARHREGDMANERLGRRNVLAGTAVAMAAAAAGRASSADAHSAGPPNPPPDLFLKNGKVITIDARSSVAQAMAIAGDKIVAVGPDAAMAALTAPTTRVIDLKGR